MKVQDFVNAGLRCLSCGSDKLRAGYHEHQLWDSWICETCGYRWMEDLFPKIYEDRLMQLLKKPKKEQRKRLIWVLHVAGRPNRPLKNPHSSDKTDYDKFIKGQEPSFSVNVA